MMGRTVVLLIIFFTCCHYLYFDFAACSNSRCRETEWKALMDFKGSLIDEGNRLSSWTGRDCCSWEGITCHNRTNFVQMIDLSNDNINYNLEKAKELGGYINSSLLNLEHLEHLDLRTNYFSGISIPTVLGSLRNLKYLDLSDAGFGGEIPQHLGNLSHLQHLSLAGELSSRSLNWIIGLSSLTSLKLTAVNLSQSVSWLDSINKLSSLSSLSLVNCGLVGMALSGDLNLTSLVSIDLSYNKFNSTLPLSFFNLSSLEDITFYSARFQGGIPNMFQKLTSLNRLDLSSTSLSSSIPNSLCALTGLTHLDLHLCELQGSIPVCLGNLTNLVFLELGENELSGAIPDELGFLTQLNQLHLWYNQLSDRIPSTLGKLAKLQMLDISENSLMGELSESFFEGMKGLHFLSMSKNIHIVFNNVSPKWIPHFQFEHLDMDSVFIGLRTPSLSWLQTQTNLTYLVLRNTSISGVVPDWCHCCTQLETFDLSRNLLTGPIPSFSRINQETITNLKLSHNQLTGEIPDALCNLYSMEVLELANNRLIGRIPSCLGNLRSLKELNLANNSLSGHIPYEIGYLNQLSILRLDVNKLFGEVPSSLQNLTRLQILHLGGNAFHGPIPNWIGKEFTELEHLMLQSNNFSGEISLNICHLSSLMILNLPDNSLVGTIPSCLGNLSKMSSNPFPIHLYDDPLLSIISKGNELEYSSDYLFLTMFISLSGNQLHGNIPDELMALTGLQNLNLSNNKLTGNIPERIGNMKLLESLDLSMNHLSGTIPQSLAGIDTLGYLNLSFNNLSGMIPSGGHFDTFDDPSIYKGNGELCGKLTTKRCDGDSIPSKQNGVISDDSEDVGIELEWLYAGIGPGFAVGFLGVFCLLFFKSSWRYRYFRFLENVYNRF